MHNLMVCSKCVIISDAAHRANDAVNEKLAHNGWDIRNCWMAFRLADGTGDGTLYDTKRDAIRHCGNNEKYYFFYCFRNAPGGSNPRDMQIWINMHRHAYDNGGHLTDPDAPDGGGDRIMSTQHYDRINGRERAPRPTLIPGIEY